MPRTINFTKYTAREILTALVEGLRNPHYKVNMSTFGFIDQEVNKDNEYSIVCFACAATNAITSLTDFKFNPSNITHREHAFEAKGIKLIGNLNSFEMALDMLRKGHLNGYNVFDFATIINPRNINLPRLGNNYTAEDLLVYESLINDQIED